MLAPALRDEQCLHQNQHCSSCYKQHHQHCFTVKFVMQCRHQHYPIVNKACWSQEYNYSYINHGHLTVCHMIIPAGTHVVMVCQHLSYLFSNILHSQLLWCHFFFFLKCLIVKHNHSITCNVQQVGYCNLKIFCIKNISI